MFVIPTFCVNMLVFHSNEGTLANFDLILFVFSDQHGDAPDLGARFGSEHPWIL